MNDGEMAYSQVMAHGSRFVLDRWIWRYDGNRPVRRFSCSDQYDAVVFAHLTYGASLRDIDEPFGLAELDHSERTVYTLGATRLELCLPVLPWARFRNPKAGVKVHSLLDPRGSIAAFTRITISVYRLVGIARGRLGIERDSYTILQALRVHPFEGTLLARLLSDEGSTLGGGDIHNQLDSWLDTTESP
jgi:hypothetical protein